MPEVQDVVNEFGALIVGQQTLPEDDPRQAYISIAAICIQEFVRVTMWAYESGRLPLPDEGQFKEGDPSFKPLHVVE